MPPRGHVIGERGSSVQLVVGAGGELATQLEMVADGGGSTQRATWCRGGREIAVAMGQSAVAATDINKRLEPVGFAR